MPRLWLLIVLLADGRLARSRELQESAESMEVKREELSTEGLGVAYTLLGVSVFALMAAYLVHWQDDDVRRYAWDVLSMAVSVFASLLTFATLHGGLEQLLVPEKEQGFMCALGYLMFLAWFILLLLVIGFSTGVVCSNIPEDEIELEDWVMEDETLTSHKEIVDPARIVYKRWGRGIATDMENHPIFCRHRNLAMETIESRMRSLTVFFSHTAAFASIYAGVVLQHLPFFAQNALTSLLAALCHLLVVFVAFRFAEIFSCRGRPEQLVDLFFESVDDAELDVLGLSTSYLLVACLAQALTNSQSSFELFQLPSSLTLASAFAIFFTGLGILAFSVMLMLVWQRKPQESATRTKMRELSQSSTALAFSWCAVRAVKWAIVDLSKKRFITVLPGSLIVLLAAALTMSATSFVLILPLDKIEDSVRHLGAGRIFKDVIIALGLVVGVSWAPVFRKSIAAAAHGYTHPRAVQLALTLGLVALLLPAWKRFILTKQISYTATRVERRSRSYLAKDHDVLMPDQPKELRGCSFR